MNTQIELDVMLLAAGEGTRLRPYTLIKPKPAIPFLTVPLAQYSLHLIKDFSIQNLVVNTFHLPDKMRNTIQQLNPKCQNLYFSHEEPKILGSGGGIVNAKDHLTNSDTFLMMNSDEVILPHHKNLMQDFYLHHKTSGALATLLTMNYPGVGEKFGGVWVDESNNVLGFGKNTVVNPSVKNKAKNGLHFIGPILLNKEIFNYLPKSGESNILYDGLVKAISNNELVTAYNASCNWHETGNVEDFLSASKSCIEGLINSKSEYWSQYLKSVIEQYWGQEFCLDTKTCTLSIEPRSQHIKVKNFACIGSGVTTSQEIVLDSVCVDSGYYLRQNESHTILLNS